MSQFTLKSLGKALDELAALQDTLPAAEMTALAEAAKKLLVAASAKSGGVKAGERSFVVRRPTKRNGYASAVLVGRGFATLDEYGSYKKPGGYYEEAHAGYVLAGKPSSNWSGFAASVFHPAEKAHPYADGAAVEIGILADAAYNRAQAAALKKVGL